MRHEFSAINIAADPHPTGIYERMIRESSARRAYYWGNEKVALVAETGDDEGIFGRIVRFTEIDPTGKATLLDGRYETVSLEDSGLGKAFAGQYGFNVRIFSFYFENSSHTLCIETKNAEKQQISARNLARSLEKIFEKFCHENDIRIALTTVPEAGTVERALSIPQLSSLEIFLETPNPDGLGSDEERVLEKLKKRKAKNFRQEYRKDSREETLTPTEDDKILARVAARNGYTHAKGKDGDTKVDINTKSHPRKVIADVGQDESPAQKAKALAADFAASR